MSETSAQPPAAEPAKVSAPPETSGAALPVGADDLTKDLITAMPEVTDKTVVSPPATETPANIAVAVDKKGVKFDPNIHAANSDGSPKVNSFGSFYSKNVGKGAKRAPASTTSTPGTEQTTDEPAKFAGVEQPPGEPDAAAGAAMMLVPTVDGLMQSLFSEGVALTEQDKQVVTPVLAAYMRSKNMKDIPPGIALAMITVAIYGPKFSKPSVKERLTLIVLKVRNFFAKK